MSLISPPRVESKTSGSQYWLPLRVWKKEKATIIHTRGRGIRNLGEIQERGIEERARPGKETQEAAGKDMSVCSPQLTPGLSSFTTVIGNVSATPPPPVSSWQAGTMPQSHWNPPASNRGSCLFSLNSRELWASLGSDGKKQQQQQQQQPACIVGDLILIPGSGRCPGVSHGNPLQYSCLDNPADRGT